MLFGEIIAMYSENHTEHTDTPCGNNAGFLCCRSSGGTHSNHWDLRVKSRKNFTSFFIFILDLCLYSIWTLRPVSYEKQQRTHLARFHCSALLGACPFFVLRKVYLYRIVVNRASPPPNLVDRWLPPLIISSPSPSLSGTTWSHSTNFAFYCSRRQQPSLFHELCPPSPHTLLPAS
jgi:hypothetical protein